MILVEEYLRMHGKDITVHCLHTVKQAQENHTPWLVMDKTKVHFTLSCLIKGFIELFINKILAGLQGCS